MVGTRNGWKVPLVFVLCTDKKATTYCTIFEQLKAKAPGLNPTQINIDFEQAAIKAIKQVFPNAKIQGCYFHLKQSLLRNLSQHELKTRYENDLQFASEIRQLQALAFLPVEEVISCCCSQFKLNSTLYKIDFKYSK